MAITSATSSPANASVVLAQPEPKEVQRTGREKENDGDSDDGGTQAPKPVVNTSGQVTGTTINTKA